MGTNTKRKVTKVEPTKKMHIKLSEQAHLRIKHKAAKYGLRIGRNVSMWEYMEELSKLDLA